MDTFNQVVTIQMVWGLPQVIMAFLIILTLGLKLGTHGQPRKTSFWGELINAAVLTGLLYWGGFWGVS